MKKLTFITLVFASVLFITSCGEAKKEVKEVKEEVKKEVKKADHSDEVSKRTKMFKAKFTRVDADKDGKASKDEFLSFSRVEFKDKDAKGNNDGKLQKEECPGFATVSPDGKDLTIEEFVSARADAFESIDADNDGSFTAEDFVAFKLSSAKKAHKESKMKCEAGKCGGKDKKESKMKCEAGKCGK